MEQHGQQPAQPKASEPQPVVDAADHAQMGRYTKCDQLF
jgi:hypothetical protein